MNLELWLLLIQKSFIYFYKNIDNNLKEIIDSIPKDFPYEMLKSDDYWSVNWLYGINYNPGEIEKICDKKIEECNYEIEKKDEIVKCCSQIKICESVKSKYQWILNRIRNQ